MHAVFRFGGHNLYYVIFILCISCSFLVQPGTPNPVVKLFVVDTDNVTDITEVVVPATWKGSRWWNSFYYAVKLRIGIFSPAIRERDHKQSVIIDLISFLLTVSITWPLSLGWQMSRLPSSGWRGCNNTSSFRSTIWLDLHGVLMR